MTETGPPEELELLLELDELLEEELLLDELELLLEVLEALLEVLPELLEVLLEALELELELELLELEVLLVEVEPELLDELELDSSPWLTNRPSPPHAVSAATIKLRASGRRDFFAELRKPEGNMQNTPCINI